MNKYEHGGALNRFENGGSHEQNPNGGIPVGQDSQGVPNTVEQGETMKKDFVFSDRIQLTGRILKQLGLPKSFEGKTPAQVSKVIDNKFKDRTDKISMSTKDKMLDQIAQAQEAIKAEQEQLAQAQNANMNQGPEDMMQGQIPPGMEEYVGNQNQGMIPGMDQGGQHQMPDGSIMADSDMQGQPMAMGGNINRYAIGGAMMIPTDPPTYSVEGVKPYSSSYMSHINTPTRAMQVPRTNPDGSVIPTNQVRANQQEYNKNKTDALYGNPAGQWLFNNKDSTVADYNAFLAANQGNSAWTPQGNLKGMGKETVGCSGSQRASEKRMKEERERAYGGKINRFLDGGDISTISSGLRGLGSAVGGRFSPKPNTGLTGDSAVAPVTSIAPVTPTTVAPQPVYDITQQVRAKGGYINRYNPGGPIDTTGADVEASGVPNIAGYANLGATALELGQSAFGKSKVDTSGYTAPPKVNVGGAAMTGAAKGASAGAMFGPWGAAVGGVVGGVTGLLGGSADKKAAAEAASSYAGAQNMQTSDQRAYGGRINRYYNGGPFDEEDMNAQPTPMGPFDTSSSLGREQITSPSVHIKGKESQGLMAPSVLGRQAVPAMSRTAAPEATKDLNKKSWLGENYGNMMRYAPTAMTAYQLSQLKKPGGVTLDRLGNRFVPKYADEASMYNVANNAMNTQIGAIGQSGASGAAQRAALLGMGANYHKGISDASSQVAAQNRALDTQGQMFNLDVDKTNVSQSNQERDINDRNRANYDSQKSKLQSSLATDIGNIGKEEVQKDQVAAMMGYTWRGNYLVDRNGARVTPEQLAKDRAAINETQQKVAANEKNRLGGYITRRNT